jgi:hypothetical protein
MLLWGTEKREKCERNRKKEEKLKLTGKIYSRGTKNKYKKVCGSKYNLFLRIGTI